MKRVALILWLLAPTLGGLVACDSLRHLVGLNTDFNATRLVHLAPDWPYRVMPPAQVWSALSLQVPPRSGIPAPPASTPQSSNVDMLQHDPIWQDLYEARFAFPDRQAPTGKQILTGLLNVRAQPTTLEVILLTPLGQRLARVRDVQLPTGQSHLESEIMPATRIHGPWLAALWQVIQLDSAILSSRLAESGLTLVRAESNGGGPAGCQPQSQQVVRPQPPAKDAPILAKIQSCRSDSGHTEKAQIELSQIGITIDLVRLTPPDQPAEEH